MTYKLKYSDYSTPSGPPDPASWIGPPGPMGPAGPTGPQGEQGDPGVLDPEAPADGPVYGRGGAPAYWQPVASSVAGRVGAVILSHIDITDWNAATASLGLWKAGTVNAIAPSLILNAGGTLGAAASSAQHYLGNYNALTNTPSIGALGTGSGGGVNGNTWVVNVAGTVAADSVGAVAVSDQIVNTGSLWVRQAVSGVYGSMAVQNANNVAITAGTITGITLLATNNLQATGGSITNVATLTGTNVLLNGGSVVGMAALGLSNNDTMAPAPGGVLSGYVPAAFYYADNAGRVPVYLDNTGTLHVASLAVSILTVPTLTVQNVTLTSATATLLTAGTVATANAQITGGAITGMAALGVSSGDQIQPTPLGVNAYAGLNWYFTDAAGHVPVYVDYAGGLHVNSLVLTSLGVFGPITATSVGVNSDAWTAVLGVNAYAYSVYYTDASGHIALGIGSTGEVQAGTFYAALAAYSVAVGLTATGSNQSSALVLTAWLNEVTTVATNTGVKLSNRVGRETLVINASATNAMNVYPLLGTASIGGLAAGAPAILPPGTMMLLFQSATNKYYQLVVSGGGGGGMSGSSGLAEIAAAGTQQTARKNLNIPGNTLSTADPAYNIVQDMWEGVFAVTAATGNPTLTITRNPNIAGVSAAISAGSNVLTLTSNDLVYHLSPQPRHVGWNIAIPGAGAAGGWHVTKIQQLVGAGTTQQQIYLADPAITAASGAGAFPVFPCFTPSCAGNKIRLPGWGAAKVGKAIATTIAAIPYEVAVLTIATYVAPNQVTLSANPPGNYTNQQGFEITWGTDNTTGMLAFFQDCVNKNYRFGSVPNTGGAGIATFAWSNNPVEGNVILVGDSKTSLSMFDTTGMRFRRQIIPIHATYKPPPRRTIIAPVHQKRVMAAASPVFVHCGDSMDGFDPASHIIYSESPAGITNRSIIEQWPEKHITTLDMAIGATDWTDYWNTNPAGASALLAWWIPGNTWIQTLAVAKAGGPADCYILSQCGGNQAFAQYEPAIRAAIGAVRALAPDGSGNPPDVIMAAQGQRMIFDSGGTAPSIDAFHVSGRLLQSIAKIQQVGFLPFHKQNALMRDGIDPDYCLPRGVMPPNQQNISKTQSATLGYTCYNWAAAITLIGTSIIDAWSRTGTLFMQLSQKPDNVIAITGTSNSSVAWQVNTWGMPSACTAVIAASSPTLTTSGHRTASVTVTGYSGALHNLLIVAEAGTFTVADVGSCLYLAAGNGSGLPWRTWIIGFVSGTQVYLSDPIRMPGAQAVQTAYIGGLSFIPEDAYHTNIQLPGAAAAGALLDTTIVGVADPHTATLAVNASTAVNTAESVWVGRISQRGVIDTTVVPATGTLSTTPIFLMEVMEDFLSIRYGYFAGVTPPPILCECNIERYGGQYVPQFWCTSAGGTASLVFQKVHVSVPIPTMPEVLDLEAWAPDTTNAYEGGGTGTGHMASGHGPTSYEIVARAQQWR